MRLRWRFTLPLCADPHYVTDPLQAVVCVSCSCALSFAFWKDTLRDT